MTPDHPETIVFQTTAMAHGGDALGRHEGKVIFVPYALPDETVRVKIVEDKGHYAFARLVEVVEPSPDRVEPPCPYFGPEGCGGCQWQHIDYRAQAQIKADVVADQLARIGRIEEPPVHPTLAAPSAWAYRNHVQFHPAPGGGLGFQKALSQEVIAVDHCKVLHPLLADLYQILDMDLDGLVRLVLRAGTVTGDRMIAFEMEEDKPPALETDEPVSCVMLLSEGGHANLIGRNYITEVVAGHTYRVSASSFFQVNTPQAKRLVRLALDKLSLEGNEVVLDAYCGVGLFTTHLAEQSGLVIAMEESPSAVDDLLENTVDFDNVEVVEGAVEDALPAIGAQIDAVVLNPPRAGLERAVVEALLDRRPARLVYVSCDPATLARDAKQLTQSGYRLVEVQPVDMFPQTYHVESVSLFVSG
jgi:23S rRNA (uracil1939-C5)-methyltransferase